MNRRQSADFEQHHPGSKISLPMNDSTNFGQRNSRVSATVERAAIKHDLTIEEVKQNHFKQVKDEFSKFMRNRVTAATVDTTER